MNEIEERNKALAKLRGPFPDHQISKLPKETRKQIDERKNRVQGCMVWDCKICGGAHHKDAIHLDYVGHAALTDRLLDVDPAWSWEPQARDDRDLPLFDQYGCLWINLTVCGVTRPGYGSADGKTGGDAVKEIIGDALRNAAMRFGAALDLWHKGDLHLDDDASTPEVEQKQPEQAPQKGWREPDSQFSTPTKLFQASTLMFRELEGCGDADMIDMLELTEDWQEFVRVADKHARHYLYGGDPAPPEFIGLLVKADQMREQFKREAA